MQESFFSNLISALPEIATSPLALVGYALTIGAWVYSSVRSANLKTIIKQIAAIPETDRKSTVMAALGEVIPESISAEQWIRSKRQQYFLIAFIVTLAVALIIVAIALFRSAEVTSAQAAARAKIEICEAQVRAAKSQWEESKKSLEDRIQHLNEEIEYWKLEERRGLTGIALAPDDQKLIAIEIARAAGEKIEDLENEKKGVQSKLDTFSANLPTPVLCGS